MPNHPVLLAHGIARFDFLREIIENRLHMSTSGFADSIHYFKGIKTHLERDGFTVFHTDVAFAESVAARAEQLSGRINNILNTHGFQKVHIIAHSMGGLDTRHMIVDIDGMADKVASLTTIGTPHLGTSLADFLLDGGGNNIIEATRRFIHLDGFKDLTVQACTEFNQRAEAKECANNVVYQTYASAQKINDIFAPLQDSSDFIAGVEGENDGLVSAVSQQWKSELIGDGSARKPVAQFTFPIPADHLNEVGWWDPQEDNLISLILRPGNQIIEFEDKIKNVYLEIARGLRNLE